MIVATATFTKIADWEVDDRPLRAALRHRGVEVHQPSWDDPTYDWSRCDACLIRTTWDYHERLDEYLAWAKRVSECTKLFNCYELVRWNTDKRYLRDLEAKGVPVIPSVWLDPGSTVDLRAELQRNGWDRAFLKPVVGSTARETVRFDSSKAGIAEAQKHLDRMLERESMILQPYLSSVETEGELSAIFIDGELTHAVRKVPVNGDYRVQDDFGGKDEPITLSEEDSRLAADVLSTVEFDWLYARLDFLRDAEGKLKLTELEMVEPSLFLRHGPNAAHALADALCRRIGM